MKKILLASTALVLSAGLANAQAVTIGGQGRMGIMGTNAGAGWTWMQENRLQFNFSVAVEADHGLTFGAFSRARITNGATGVFSGSRVWVEANNLRLTFGNQDGAFRGAGAAYGYLGGCAIGYEGGQQCGDSIGLLGVTQGFASTLGGAASRVRVDYSMGDTRMALSYDRGGATEIGVRTSFDAFTVALGHTTGGAGAASTALSGWYNAGSWGVGAIIADVAGTNNWSISGNAELGGGTASAYVGQVGGANAWGINYSYGLGGGASVVAGAERVGGTTTASVGAVFNF